MTPSTQTSLSGRGHKCFRQLHSVRNGTQCWIRDQHREPRFRGYLIQAYRWFESKKSQNGSRGRGWQVPREEGRIMEVEVEVVRYQ